MLDGDLQHVLANTRPAVWDTLRGQNIFLTGGSGFVGSWLVESLLAANQQLNLAAKVLLLTRDANAFKRKFPHLASNRALHVSEGSAESFVFPPGEFPFVIHAATAESFWTGVAGTKRVLEFAATHGAQRFLFTSSGAVYGKQPLNVSHLLEDYAGAPLTVEPASGYAQAKRASEYLCAASGFDFGFQAVIARLFAFSGPRLPLDRNFAIGNFIRDALAGGPVRITGDGTPLRSYLYAADLAIWLWTLLVCGVPARPYNVGSPEGITIAALARAVVENTRPETRIEIAQIPNEAVAPVRYVPSVDRAKLELGLEPIIPLADGIKRMYSWAQRCSYTNFP